MSIKDDGGPAFGQVVDLRCVRVEMEGGTEWEPHVLADSGMRLRDYFASKAMQGLIAEPSWGGGYIPMYACMSEEKNDAAKMIAQSSYKIADAMLEARK